jgi:type IV secretory pathway VirB2 component (pilin)
LNSISEEGMADVTFSKLEGWVANEEAAEKSVWGPLAVWVVVILVVVAGVALLFTRLTRDKKSSKKKTKKK